MTSLPLLALALTVNGINSLGHERMAVDAKGHVFVQEARATRNAGPTLHSVHALPSPTAGCAQQSSLAHRLRRSRKNSSVDNTRLSFMHLDSSVRRASNQISLSLFNLWELGEDESWASLDEDQAQLLRPLLPVVTAWREKCLESDGKLLLLLPGSKHGEGSLWDTLTKDFSAFLVKKVLKARMQDIEISVPSKDVGTTDDLVSLLPLRSLLRRKAPCYRAMAVLRGDIFEEAWSRRFQCDVQDARLVRRFVNDYMRNHVDSTEIEDSEKAQVCYRGQQSQEDVDAALNLKHCQLQGKEIELKVLSDSATAADAAGCCVLLHDGTRLSGAELWIRPSTIIVEIMGKQRSQYSQNLALLTGASYFTVSRSKDRNKILQTTARVIYALNHREPRAGTSLDEFGSDVELEGCENFYHPVGGWTAGWGDVAKSLQSAQM